MAGRDLYGAFGVIVFCGGEQDDGFGNDPGAVAEPAGNDLGECVSCQGPVVGAETFH